MLNLADTFYVVQVVDSKGFAAAARKLNLPKSTLSHRIAEPEPAVGVRLLQRTLRQVVLTPSESVFYERARQLLVSAADLEDAIRSHSDKPCGIIRLTMTPELSQHALSDMLSAFLDLYPDIRIEEECTDRIVDIIAEGYDLAIGGHHATLTDSSLIQRHIARTSWTLFAGAGYLRLRDISRTPQDLEHDQALSLSRPPMKGWTLGPVMKCPGWCLSLPGCRRTIWCH